METHSRRSRTEELLRDLAVRRGVARHDEVKSSIRELLVEEFGVDRGEIDFEKRVPEVRGRLDAILGRTIFEVKSDWGRERRDAEARIPDYLDERERATKERFTAIGTDGLDWVAYERRDARLAVLKEWRLDPEKPDRFLAQLQGALALGSELKPDPLTIEIEFGADSPAYRRAAADLAALWDKLRADPSIALKRQIWTDLLRLVYGRDIESEALWIQHTFLVIVAKAIASAVLDLDTDEPHELLSGDRFFRAGIDGAVESDFFDWVLADEQGRAVVRRLLHQVARFRLREVESDVLKVLYESLIDPAERHLLGEYYTPDWLAAKVVRAAVDEPVTQSVIDPACGSGTFLFHAVRQFLAAAEAAGVPESERAARATAQVAGIDIHPVATIIARVTYLLALAPALPARAGRITIPVYVGDALQLSKQRILIGNELVITVPPPATPEPHGRIAVGERALKFPESVCEDPALFDDVVSRMHRHSENGRPAADFRAAVRALGVTDPTALSELTETYDTYDELRRTGRNSIWSYVARNLSRPLYLSADQRKADVVVGNPPWLAFRHMSRDLQTRFREMARGERIYVGGRFATQADLSSLFFVRSAALYLKQGGRIAFVMPLAALTRGQFGEFRKGSYESGKIRFEEPWVLDDDVQPLFPVPASVVFGARHPALAKAIPQSAKIFHGTLPWRNAPEDVADRHLTVEEEVDRAAHVRPSFGASPYREAFRDGATLYPRTLCIVERVQAGRLGGNPAAPLVKSWRSRQEKSPWRNLSGIESNVEAEFLRPVYLGESIAPFRVLKAFEGVIPVTAVGKVLDGDTAAKHGLVHLWGWMDRAESLWDGHKRSNFSLAGRWDYHRELSAQFPIPPLRIVYAKAGTLPAACLLRNERGIIDHMLYWMPLKEAPEGHYLAAVLNSEESRRRIQHLQARGQWGARHFDKVMFELPIPRFEGGNGLQRDLAEAGAEAERVAAVVDIPDGMHFQTARRRIREALRADGVWDRIESLVGRLLNRE